MPTLLPNTCLRKLLRVDAVVCLLSALILLLFEQRMLAMTGIAELVMQVSILILIFFGTYVGALALMQRPARWMLQVVIAGNVLWALLSISHAVLARVPLNGAGQAFIVTQALWVFGLAVAQWGAMVRSRNAS